MMNVTEFETVGDWWYTMVSVVIKSNETPGSPARALCQPLLQLLTRIPYNEVTIDGRLCRVDDLLGTIIDKMSTVAPAEVVTFLVQENSSFMHQANSFDLKELWNSDLSAARVVGRFLGKIQLTKRLSVLETNWNRSVVPCSKDKNDFVTEVGPFVMMVRQLLANLIKLAPVKTWWNKGIEWWFELCQFLIKDSSIGISVKELAVFECMQLLRRMPWKLGSVDDLRVSFKVLARLSDFILTKLAKLAPEKCLSFIVKSDGNGNWIDHMFLEIDADAFWGDGPQLLGKLLCVVKAETWLFAYFDCFLSRKSNLGPPRTKAQAEFFDQAHPLMTSFSNLLCRLIKGAPGALWPPASVPSEGSWLIPRRDDPCLALSV